MKLLREFDGQEQEIAHLETRLIAFYNTYTDYPVFNQASEYPSLWGKVLQSAAKITSSGSPCRILEIGAGRSGFGSFIRTQSTLPIHLTSQDITALNVDFLKETSDEVVTENIDQLQGSWDIIFHSYACEHFCRPAQFAELLWQKLRVGGYLIIQSPRYDFPFYLPPSLDHLSFTKRTMHRLQLIWLDLVSALTSKKQFVIFSDPAVFHLPFWRDRDAVHRVCRSDLTRLFAQRAKIENFPLPSGGWKDFLVKRFLTLRIALKKLA